jgi:hypothetical protein
MTWLQIDVLELVFESAREQLMHMPRRFAPHAVTCEEARAALAAERHLEAIRQPHPLCGWSARAFNHLI